MRKVCHLILSIVLFAAVAVPLAAHAYVGPGAGLSLLGALWGLLAGVGAALAFIVAWPIRRMLKKRRAADDADTAQADQGGVETR